MSSRRPYKLDRVAIRIIIDNDDHYYSFQENKILKVPSLETIRSAASDLIGKIDGHLYDLQKEKAKGKESIMEVAAATETRADVGANVGRNVGLNVGVNADHSKKSICAELKASAIKRTVSAKKPMPRNREEVL